VNASGQISTAGAEQNNSARCIYTLMTNDLTRFVGSYDGKQKATCGTTDSIFGHTDKP
jgi:hypothetical protein